jgi:Ca2+-binding EF-hand superfamily protein
MQSIGISSLFGSRPVQTLLNLIGPAPASTTGQTSPTGANDTTSAATPAPPRPDQGPGAQFAASTLASLLGVQQQQPSSAGDLASALIGQADANGDGGLDAQEIQSILGSGSGAPSADDITSALGKLDTNGDGKLSADELSAGFASMAKAHGHHHGHQAASSADLAQKLISGGDADGDGELSADEISAQLPAQASGLSGDALKTAIQKLDTDGDGKLSGAELAAAIDAMRSAYPSGTATRSAQA